MKTIFAISITFLTCFALLVSSTSSMMKIRVDVTCPLCGTKFRAEEVISEYKTGMRLDMKPLGAVAAPWPLAVCPSCHFVVYNQVLPERDKRILSEFVQSEEYRRLVKKWPSYYLLAKLFEQLPGSKEVIAHMYLKASWQVEDDPTKCKESLAESLKFLNAAFAEESGMEQEWPTGQRLAGELERHLGEFGEP